MTPISSPRVAQLQSSTTRERSKRLAGRATSGGGFSGSITVNNTGSVIAKSGILLLGTLFTQTAGSTLLEGGNIATSGSTTMTVTGGDVFGAGTITGGLTNTSGLVSASPSLSSTTTGTLTISGSGAGYYTQGSGGTVEFGLAGSSAGEYDVLTATGAATLAGSAQLCLLKGFKPTVGSTFQVMNYASETGNFSTVNFGWTLTPGTTSATATYNGAPVTSFSPSSLAFPSTLVNTASAPLTADAEQSGRSGSDDLEYCGRRHGRKRFRDHGEDVRRQPGGRSEVHNIGDFHSRGAGGALGLHRSNRRRLPESADDSFERQRHRDHDVAFAGQLRQRDGRDDQRTDDGDCDQSWNDCSKGHKCHDHGSG